MIYQQYPADEDLMVFMTQPAFVPVKYRHLENGTVYTVISAGQFHLNIFSEGGILHEFPHEGRLVICTLQFSGGVDQNSRYAGPITIYVGEDGQYWMRPDFEFNDGRFERIND